MNASKPKKEPSSTLFNPDLQKGERKAKKKLLKAERKAFRLRDEAAEAATVNKLNESIQRVDYLAILDFEATCDDTVKFDVQEIIEFPTVFVSTATGEVDFVFHTYVQPQKHPTLTAFCTKLTGIQQQTVDGGISLPEALKSHEAFLVEHGLVPAANVMDEEHGNKESKTFVYVTCGDWDLRTCLPAQLQHLPIACPRPLKSWCNLKVVFQQVYGVKAKGMTSMLDHLKLELEGKHHSGIDDCKNLARIVKEMLLNGGWKPHRGIITGTALR